MHRWRFHLKRKIKSGYIYSFIILIITTQVLNISDSCKGYVKSFDTLCYNHFTYIKKYECILVNSVILLFKSLQFRKEEKYISKSISHFFT